MSSKLAPVLFFSTIKMNSIINTSSDFFKPGVAGTKPPQKTDAYQYPAMEKGEKHIL